MTYMKWEDRCGHTDVVILLSITSLIAMLISFSEKKKKKVSRIRYAMHCINHQGKKKKKVNYDQVFIWSHSLVSGDHLNVFLYRFFFF